MKQIAIAITIGVVSTLIATYVFAKVIAPRMRKKDQAATE